MSPTAGDALQIYGKCMRNILGCFLFFLVVYYVLGEFLIIKNNHSTCWTRVDYSQLGTTCKYAPLVGYIYHLVFQHEQSGELTVINILEQPMQKSAIHQKYSAAYCIFNSLVGVWKYCQTQSFVLYMHYFPNRMINMYLKIYKGQSAEANLVRSRFGIICH